LSFSVHLFLIGFLVSCCAIFFTSGNCTHINYKNRTFCYTKVIVTKLLKKKNCCIYDGLWCLRHNAQVPISFQGYGASLLLGLWSQIIDRDETVLVTTFLLTNAFIHVMSFCHHLAPLFLL
jgi:hypothetical protein